MKTLGAAIVMMLMPVLVHAGDLVISLKTDVLKIDATGFYVEDVVDARKVKSNIGVARTGAFNVTSNVSLDGGFRPALLDYFGRSFPVSNDKAAVTLKVVEFSVDEKMEFPSEKAVGKALIEFYKKQGDGYVNVCRSAVNVEQKSSVDCTKYHEQNVKELLRRSFAVFVSSSVEYTASATGTATVSASALTEGPISDSASVEVKQEDAKQLYYNVDWLGAGELSMNYGFSYKNVLLQYRREEILGHHENHTNLYSYSIGATQINGSDIEVDCGSAGNKTGKYTATIVPVSLAIHRFVNSGFWKGKWGIGLTSYYYSGEIDMAPYDSLHKGDGLGLNVSLPGEIVVGSGGKKDLLFRLNYDIQIPLIKNRYSSGYGYIDGAGYNGIYLGLTLGKYWK
jgi:hypothetical protein